MSDNFGVRDVSYSLVVVVNQFCCHSLLSHSKSLWGSTYFLNCLCARCSFFVTAQTIFNNEFVCHTHSRFFISNDDDNAVAKPFHRQEEEKPSTDSNHHRLSRAFSSSPSPLTSSSLSSPLRRRLNALNVISGVPPSIADGPLLRLLVEKFLLSHRNHPALARRAAKLAAERVELALAQLAADGKNIMTRDVNDHCFEVSD